MLGRIFTVGGYTLLSRLTGFARDIMLAAILGAGPVADAFFVALRLPNHFRAIFAEGAFNAAFVPAYAHLHGKGEASAKLFADRIFTLLFGVTSIVRWVIGPSLISRVIPQIHAELLIVGAPSLPPSVEHDQPDVQTPIVTRAYEHTQHMGGNTAASYLHEA